MHGSTAHENHVSADGQLLQLGHRAGADSAGASLHGAAREVDHRHLAGTGAQPKKPRPFATAAPPSPTTCRPSGTARATQSPSCARTMPAARCPQARGETHNNSLQKRWWLLQNLRAGTVSRLTELATAQKACLTGIVICLSPPWTAFQVVEPGSAIATMVRTR